MSVEIRLPTALRAFADKKEKIAVEAKNVGEALNALFARHDRLKTQLLNPDGKLRSFVNVYVNDDDARDKQGLNTPVKDGDTVLIVPAIAGGATLSAGAELTKAEMIRYDRHLIMPEVGPEGQKKLKNSSVLCIGAGGLGSPLALYLAAAGVGQPGSSTSTWSTNPTSSGRSFTTRPRSARRSLRPPRNGFLRSIRTYKSRRTKYG